MPKKNPGMNSEEQSEAFRAKVREMIDAGELNPIDADAALERAMAGVKLDPKGKSD